jgi:hypothetical protein
MTFHVFTFLNRTLLKKIKTLKFTIGQFESHHEYLFSVDHMKGRKLETQNLNFG